MSSVQSILSSRKVNRAMPWVAGLVLAAGVGAVLFTFFRNTAEPVPQTFSGGPAQLPAKQQPTVPLAPEVRRTAAKFILTAVGRDDLAYAWKISGPNIRGGLTYKEWMTGFIPVVPYPKKAIEITPFKIDESYANEAWLQVAILPKQGYDIKPQLFVIGLKKVGKGNNGRWIVDYWAPKGSPALPNVRD